MDFKIFGYWIILFGFLGNFNHIFTPADTEQQLMMPQLPPGVEIVSSKELGLSDEDVKKFLSGMNSGENSPKTQILSIGFKPNEKLNLQNAQPIPKVGLKGSDKIISDIAANDIHKPPPYGMKIKNNETPRGNSIQNQPIPRTQAPAPSMGFRNTIGQQQTILDSINADLHKQIMLELQEMGKQQQKSQSQAPRDSQPIRTQQPTPQTNRPQQQYLHAIRTQQPNSQQVKPQQPITASQNPQPIRPQQLNYKPITSSSQQQTPTKPVVQIMVVEEKNHEPIRAQTPISIPPTQKPNFQSIKAEEHQQHRTFPLIPRKDSTKTNSAEKSKSNDSDKSAYPYFPKKDSAKPQEPINSKDSEKSVEFEYREPQFITLASNSQKTEIDLVKELSSEVKSEENSAEKLEQLAPSPTVATVTAPPPPVIHQVLSTPQSFPHPQFILSQQPHGQPMQYFISSTPQPILINAQQQQQILGDVQQQGPVQFSESQNNNTSGEAVQFIPGPPVYLHPQHQGMMYPPGTQIFQGPQGQILYQHPQQHLMPQQLFQGQPQVFQAQSFPIQNEEAQQQPGQQPPQMVHTQQNGQQYIHGPPQQFVQGVPPQQQFVQGVPPQQQFVQGVPPSQQFVEGTLPPQQYFQGVPPPQQFVQGAPPPQQFIQESPPQQQYVQGPPPQQQFIQESPPQQQYVQGPPPQQQFIQVQGPPPQQYLQESSQEQQPLNPIPQQQFVQVPPTTQYLYEGQSGFPREEPINAQNQIQSQPHTQMEYTQVHQQQYFRDGPQAPEAENGHSPTYTTRQTYSLPPQTIVYGQQPPSYRETELLKSNQKEIDHENRINEITREMLKFLRHPSGNELQLELTTPSPFRFPPLPEQTQNNPPSFFESEFYRSLQQKQRGQEELELTTSLKTQSYPFKSQFNFKDTGFKFPDTKKPTDFSFFTKAPFEPSVPSMVRISDPENAMPHHLGKSRGLSSHSDLLRSESRSPLYSRHTPTTSVGVGGGSHYNKNLDHNFSKGYLMGEMLEKMLKRN